MATGASEIEAVTRQLLNGEFDINLLDQVVSAAYDPVSPHRAQANRALMQLQESPDLWQRADGIIEQSQNPNSRFFGLQVLDDAIKTRYVFREGMSSSGKSIWTTDCLTALFSQMEDSTSRAEGGDKELCCGKGHQNVIRRGCDEQRESVH
jgi:hypothetical protein